MRKLNLVAPIASLKFKTMESVENDKGGKRGQGWLFPRADRREVDGVTHGL